MALPGLFSSLKCLHALALHTSLHMAVNNWAPSQGRPPILLQLPLWLGEPGQLRIRAILREGCVQNRGGGVGGGGDQEEHRTRDAG